MNNSFSGRFEQKSAIKRTPKMYPRRYTKDLRQFVAKDEDGKEYIIVQTQDFIDTTDDQGKTTTTSLPAKFTTIDGRGVDRVCKGHYELTGGWQKIKVASKDRKAP